MFNWILLTPGMCRKVRLRAAGDRMRRQVASWFTDESGQDLVEYALLVTLIGIAIVAGVAALGGAMQFVYGTWDSAIQSPTVVEVPDPQ